MYEEMITALKDAADDKSVVIATFTGKTCNYLHLPKLMWCAYLFRISTNDFYKLIIENTGQIVGTLGVGVSKITRCSCKTRGITLNAIFLELCSFLTKF